MAQAIILPLIENGHLLPENIVAIVKTEESADRLLKKMPSGIHIISHKESSAKIVWEAPIKLLAIKPQQLSQLEIDTKPHINALNKNSSILVSLLAGIKLSRLESLFPNSSCVRVVPNLPVLIGEGLTGIAWGTLIKDFQKESVVKIFEPVSEIFELAEPNLDAFLALTSSGPAYVALILEALADGAVAAGLSRQLSNSLAIKTLASSASLLKKKELQPIELKEMVASPGGTTITALRHLEKVGFRSALIEAVMIAAQRSHEISLEA